MRKNSFYCFKANFLKFSFLHFLLLFIPALKIHAQVKPVGYINTQLLYSSLSEYSLISKELEEFNKQNEYRMQQKKKVLDEKVHNHYKKQNADTGKYSPNSLLATERIALEKESQDFYEEIKNNQQASFTKKEMLYKGVTDKVRKAIADVAAEKGYSGIIDINSVVYYSEKDDITALVLSKLGIK